MAKCEDTAVQSSENSPSSDDLICTMCCQEAVKAWAIGVCDHPTCLRCCVKMRLLCGLKECAVCRTVPRKILVVHTVHPFSSFKETHSWHCDKKFGMYFQTWTLQNIYTTMRDFQCKKCTVSPFRNFKHLRDHMLKIHNLLYCDICTDNLKLFPTEFKVYTRKQLTIHQRDGDKDDPSYKGHPLCEFCNERYFDNDDLHSHLRKNHFWCHFCEGDGKQDYFNNYSLLRVHFRERHYLCEHGDCKHEKYTSVFRSQIDLQAHRATTHIKGLSRTEVKQMKQIDVAFEYARTRQDTDNGVGGASGPSVMAAGSRNVYSRRGGNMRGNGRSNSHQRKNTEDFDVNVSASQESGKRKPKTSKKPPEQRTHQPVRAPPGLSGPPLQSTPATASIQNKNSVPVDKGCFDPYGSTSLPNVTVTVQTPLQTEASTYSSTQQQLQPTMQASTSGSPQQPIKVPMSATTKPPPGFVGHTHHHHNTVPVRDSEVETEWPDLSCSHNTPEVPSNPPPPPYTPTTHYQPPPPPPPGLNGSVHTRPPMMYMCGNAMAAEVGGAPSGRSQYWPQQTAPVNQSYQATCSSTSHGVLSPNLQSSQFPSIGTTTAHSAPSLVGGSASVTISVPRSKNRKSIAIDKIHQALNYDKDLYDYFKSATGLYMNDKINVQEYKRECVDLFGGARKWREIGPVISELMPGQDKKNEILALIGIPPVITNSVNNNYTTGTEVPSVPYNIMVRQNAAQCPISVTVGTAPNWNRPGGRNKCSTINTAVISGGGSSCGVSFKEEEYPTLSAAANVPSRLVQHAPPPWNVVIQ